MSDYIDRLVCRLFGHDDRYGDRFVNRYGHEQCDKVCKRCGRRSVAWTGPHIDVLLDVCDADSPEEIGLEPRNNGQ